ncbi:MAG: rod shape-determining protein MreC [Leptothrix sp. (in: b-proteobacteria)]
MAQGTLDRTPPPFFRQGPSALTRVVFFASLAIFLMAADTRLGISQPLRSVVAAVLLPVERVLMLPVAMVAATEEYLAGLDAARQAEAAARAALSNQAQRQLQLGQLEQENIRLRGLLGLKAHVTTRSLAAQVMYDAPDPYTRKVVIDAGRTQGVLLSSPVINEMGVLGQVTRVYPMTSEVTLLADRDAIIPVINARTQKRGVAYGHPGSGGMELRFMAGNADVQIGDTLSTSGLDGVYPAGYPVAKVAHVDRQADSSFAKIMLTPAAQADGVRHVLVLEPIGRQLPPRPEPVTVAPPRGKTAGK